MSENLRSLIYIIVLALITFFIAKKLMKSFVSEKQFNLWRNTWLAITMIAFLAGNFWIFAILTAILLLYVGKKESNSFALFFVLLFTIPRIGEFVPALGIMNYLITLDYVMILSFMVLLPSYLSLRKNKDVAPFLSYWIDKIILAYIVLIVILHIRDTTFMEGLRSGVTGFTDIFLPYYVASRSLKNLKQFKEVIAAFVIASMVAATTAMFEYSHYWLLYANLKNSLGVPWNMGGYLGRGDSLRAVVTLGQPIILGYLMVMAMAGYLFLSNQIKSKFLRWLGWAIILGGLYAPISRGPWIGSLVLIVTFILLSPNAFKNISKMLVVTIITIGIINLTPAGKKIIDLLPFIGQVDSENVDYRVRLIDSASIVFNRHPLFGSSTFYDELAALGMTQGEGIVDIVNSYLLEVLTNGLVGLSLFVSFFLIIIYNLFNSLKNSPDKSNDMHRLGRTLLASVVATMVTITTVSSILVLPVIYWAFGGISIAYTRVIAQLDAIKQAAELQSYRLAFEVMPALPASRVAFSALNKHQVVIDTNSVPRIAMSNKSSQYFNTPKQKLTTPTIVERAVKTTKPNLGSLYLQARKNRPINSPYFEKTLQLPVKVKPKDTEPLLKTPNLVIGKLFIRSGSSAGKVLSLTKSINKIGKANIQVAIIVKRESGYFIKHLEGKNQPFVNDVSIGYRAQLLSNKDIIEVMGIKMQIFIKPTDTTSLE